MNAPPEERHPAGDMGPLGRTRLELMYAQRKGDMVRKQMVAAALRELIRKGAR